MTNDLARPVAGRPQAGLGAGAYASAAGIFVLSVILAHLASPLRAEAPVAFDTISVVLYFDRIVHGVVLEAPILTTPKPLLSLVYGATWELTGDWRWIVLISVLASAGSAALATLLAWRIAGPAAGLFAGAAIAGSSMLVMEAVRGLATPWAILGWMLAGLAVTARRPRYGIAGLALALAALARIETLAIVGAAVVLLVVVSVGPRRVRRHVPGRAWLVLLGLLALPVMLAHDWLLIRDPWYWAGVSGAYAAQNPQPSGMAGVRSVLELLVKLLAQMLGMVVLAVPGTVILLRRTPVVGIGLLALAGGVASFMLLIGYLGYMVPGRYAAPIEVAVMMAAAIAVGAAAENLEARLRRRQTTTTRGEGPVRIVPAVLGVAGLVTALVLTNPLAPASKGLHRVVQDRRALNGAALDATDAIRAALQDAANGPGTPPVIRVQSQVRPLLALELGLDLTRIQVLPNPPDRALASDTAQGGGLVLYIPAEDESGRGASLATTEPTTVGTVRITPITSDADMGWWLSRLDATPSTEGEAGG